jgi:hypothetical protein
MADFEDISVKMEESNRKEKIEIMKKWDIVFRHLLPNKRNGFVF